MDSNSQTGNDGDETLDDALKILNEDDPNLTNEEKDAEATEEIGTVLGDLA